MPRHIDAEKIDFRLPYFEDENGDALVSLRAVKQCIDATPTADVVEVVRCCDCKYCEVVIHSIIDEPKWFCTRMVRSFDVDPTCFCSYGERKG